MTTEPQQDVVESATHSMEDNKLRLYLKDPDRRLDEPTYRSIHAVGFRWAPKQKLFVAPAWSPEAEDALLSLVDEIDDEETPLAERAAERAERFEVYSDKRAADADAARQHVERIAGGIPMGQPIIRGHHSQRKAEKDAERIESGMKAAVRLHDTSEYWERRAERVMRHAAYKADPGLRARRIKTLEADQRRHQRSLAHAEQFAGLWQKVAACTDPAEQLKIALAVANHDHGGAWYKIKDGALAPAQAAEQGIASHAAIAAYERRWIEHLTNRLAYERVLLGRAPDQEIKVDRTRTGAAALPLLNYKAPEGRISIRRRFGGEVESRRQVEMTSAEYQRIYHEQRGTQVSEDGTHRVRSAIVHTKGSGSYGGEHVVVFLSDKGAHPVPIPKPKAHEPTAEEIEEEAAEEVVEPEASEPSDPEPVTFTEPEEPEPPEPVNPFEAMRQSLKAGVKAVSVPELFVTPPDLAERVADEAYIYPGMTVLEPNGGLGALAEAARKRDGDVTCVEIAHAAVQVLRGKGFTVHHDDFLTVDLGGQTFDRVVANPPFSAEIPHVQRAWSMLKPGGRLVAIMSAGVSFRQDKATKAFRDFVEEHGEMEDLPEDSFASSGTNVRTVLVTLDKPQ